MANVLDGWQSLQVYPRLQEDQVALWCATLNQPDNVVGQLCTLLTSEELARAERFRRLEHQRCAIVARGVLRAILGGYLAMAPRNIALSCDSYGKPGLASPDGLEPFQFNLSHSGSLVLYAFALDRLVGIDVEQISPVPDMDTLARRNFSEREYAEFQQLAPACKLEAFFQTWTRKEAYVKALGKGLSEPLDGFAVTLGPVRPARLDWVAGDPGAPQRWMMHDLPIGPGYAAAVVGQAPVDTFTHQQWTHDLLPR
jgi:4'-phosphopantetheinyl transferase